MKTTYLSKWLTALVSASMTLVFMGVVLADHQNLGDSFFEIDDSANLKVDAADHFDWANVADARQLDSPSGTNDDAFGQGTKEDSEVPSPVTGSIPPNKSDLKTFGVHLEDDGVNRYLHLFWHRVQDPSGTTNMDFEFNQGEVLSSNGVTPVRMAGDALVQYDLANGGVVPELFLSRWIDGSEEPPRTSNDCEASNKLPCWSAKVSLTGLNVAIGSINLSSIEGAHSDGLDEISGISARTFGEATIDFGALTAALGEGCTSFGSAYLKSRSSDSFTSAVKDYIAPLQVNVDNCATLRIIKQDDSDPGVRLNGASFEVWADNDPGDGAAPDFNVDGLENGSDPRLPNYTCTTPQPSLGVCEFLGVLAGDYWVVETGAPTGHNLASPAYQLVTITAGGEDVEATFTNPRKPASVVITKTDDAVPPNLLSGATFTLYTDDDPPEYDAGDTDIAGSCTTIADGTCTISNILPPGDYCLVETGVPTGYSAASPQCFALALDQNKSVSFVDPRHTGAIKITKTRKHAASGSGDYPHAGVKFTITGGELVAPGTEVTTDANGTACLGGLVLSSHVGGYTVTETVPTNYVADGNASKSVLVTQVATCGSGNEDPVAFSNTPLTNITVSVDSLVDGGTKSTIHCVIQGGASVGSVDPAQEDPTLNLTNKLPGTYVCTIFVDP